MKDESGKEVDREGKPDPKAISMTLDLIWWTVRSQWSVLSGGLEG